MFLRFLARLPLSVLYLLSGPLYVVLRYLYRYRRGVVQSNLRNAFPDLQPGELKELEARFYRNFSDSFMETLRGLTISPEDITNRVEFTNMDLLQGEADRGQSVLLLVAHQFNWEWMLAAFSVQAPFLVQAVYKPPHLKNFDRFLYATRSRFGAELLPQKRAVTEIRRGRERPRGVALIADQSESGPVGDYWTEFLNQNTAFSQNIQRLANITQFPVFFAQVVKKARGRYAVTFLEIARPPYERDDTRVIRRYVAAVEQQILAHPDGWLWTNRKWKQRLPNTPESGQ